MWTSYFQDFSYLKKGDCSCLQVGIHFSLLHRRGLKALVTQMCLVSEAQLYFKNACFLNFYAEMSKQVFEKVLQPFFT